MLVQKMALNVDVGFLLALGDFIPTDSSRLLDVSQKYRALLAIVTISYRRRTTERQNKQLH